jgi:poly-gamma-glutamate capsule biosynthesis protein CapA/YwtB (metallophosphatase superfamily)
VIPSRARLRSPLLAGLLACCLLAAACGGGDDATADDPGGAGAGAAGETSSTAGQDPTTTAAPRGPLGSGEPVRIAFAGDASFEGLVGSLQADPEGLLDAIAPTLGAADVTVVNLEAALGTAGGSPEPKTFAFRVPAEALVALSSAGVDAVTMANNHGMDYGPDGLAESLRIEADTGFPILGIGTDEDAAYSPWITEVNGQRIGVIAANDIFDSNLVARWTAGPDQPGIASAEEAHQDRLVAEVEATRDQVDTLVVYLHYGTEKQTCPNARQVELAELLTGAGADIVVGSHAHRLQGMGYMGDQFVAYGLSNFVFKAPSPPGRRSGVLTVTATGRRIDGYQWDPATLQNNIPVPLSGAAADAERAAMDELQSCTGLSATATGPGVGG